uniref:Uncharacterized protein n=1 Tax=Arundo donax TaxID=35708 RepID=A0A0A8XSG7_ARUDO
MRMARSPRRRGRLPPGGRKWEGRRK